MSPTRRGLPGGPVIRTANFFFFIIIFTRFLLFLQAFAIFHLHRESEIDSIYTINDVT